ncbi:MAG: cytosolic protein [Acidobacteria bacterium]|nr:cytosolic protein [Acidobacteriota bacterium]
MMPVTIQEITAYIERNIQEFHRRRLESLAKLKLKKVLLRKNPYLYRAKDIIDAHDLVKSLLDAHLSSQEEGIFGDFLEGLAVYVCSKAYGGRKSSANGIDLEFERENIYNLVSIKSGPNWGNSRQIAKMREDFTKAKRILRTSGSVKHVEAINGCCYGREQSEDKGEYLKLCGESFWAFISGQRSLYTDIIEPLGHQAKQRNEEFAIEYSKVINRFTKEFIESFCDLNGQIDWVKLVTFNSGKN